jgi:Acetyltransferase (GNAT) domain
MRPLDPPYTPEVDAVDEQRWYRILQEFDDANIQQTYAAGSVSCSRGNLSHLILKKNDEIVAAAQARITRIPLVNVGTATIQSGPLWRRGASKPDPEVFRQAVRALRNEYVCRRGLVLRLYPDLYSDDSPHFTSVLAEEGLPLSPNGAGNRTIVMDLGPSLDELHGGLGKNWKRNLKLANRGGLELIEGTSEDLFEAFLGIYKEMVSRKKFVSFADINKFRRMQVLLPENFKLIIMLARSDQGLCAGLICTAIGKSAAYLFGATSNAGLKSSGSYLLQWKLIEKLKERGFSTYDLDGIDPIENPGTYTYKKDLAGVNGRDVYLLGRFDSHPGPLSHAFVNLGDGLKALRRNGRELVAGFHFEGARAKG